MKSKSLSLITSFHDAVLKSCQGVLPNKISQNGELNPAATALNIPGGVKHEVGSTRQPFLRYMPMVMFKPISKMHEPLISKGSFFSIRLNIHTMVNEEQHVPIHERIVRNLEKNLSDIDDVETFEISNDPVPDCASLGGRVECVSTISIDLYSYLVFRRNPYENFADIAKEILD